MRAERAERRALMGNVRMQVDQADPSGKMVFEAKGLSHAFGASPVVTDLSLRVMRGDRIGLIGANGAGKTTLLRLLLGEMAPQAGEVRRGANVQVAYYDQQREQLDPDRTVVDTVGDGADTVTVNGVPKHVHGYLADFLFSPERARSPVRALSAASAIACCWRGSLRGPPTCWCWTSRPTTSISRRLNSSKRNWWNGPERSCSQP